MSIAGKCSIVYQQGLSNKAVTVLYRYALQVIPADRRQCKTLHLLQIRKKIIEALHERDTEVLNMLSAAPGATGKLQPSMRSFAEINSGTANHQRICHRVLHASFVHPCLQSTRCLFLNFNMTLQYVSHLYVLRTGAMTAISTGKIPCVGFGAGAGLPTVKAISKITAPCPPSSIQRSHSASSDIVKAALRQHSANVHNSKSDYRRRSTAAARRTLQGCHVIMTP